ncbi:hypothetical protein WS62_13855 [Burkholderia sp. ABCPW 14]|nr:hypothetical protein WS62_13855 [Burkholderia sp. ABCPW 14]
MQTRHSKIFGQRSLSRLQHVATLDGFSFARRKFFIKTIYFTWVRDHLFGDKIYQRQKLCRSLNVIPDIKFARMHTFISHHAHDIQRPLNLWTEAFLNERSNVGIDIFAGFC